MTILKETLQYIFTNISSVEKKENKKETEKEKDPEGLGSGEQNKGICLLYL